VSTAAETETETAPQLNDIEERLGKYEWEKRNLADLPGTYTFCGTVLYMIHIYT